MIEVDETGASTGGVGNGGGLAGEVFAGPASPQSASRRRRRKGASCETCFFGCHDLCALEVGGPCATYRPNDPAGLTPPQQPPLLVRDSEVSLTV